MQESGKTSFLLKKSYEMAYALFRVSAKVQEKSFAENIGRQGIGLLGAVAVGNYNEAGRAVTAIWYFAKLGVDLGFISLSNGDLIFRELAALQEMLFESGNPANTDGMNPANVDISDIFSEKPYVNDAEEGFEPEQESELEMETESDLKTEIEDSIVEPSIIHRAEIRQRDYRTEAPTNPAIRQTKLLERIRQSGNCRIKDLQEVLPECSERTIRYDLQTLIEQGVIERRGNGGPAVSYRIRQDTGSDSQE